MLKIFRRFLWGYVLVSVGVCNALEEQKNVYENGIVAYVEDRVITKQQLEIETMRRGKDQQIHDQSLEEIQSRVLNDMIENKVIIREFERMKGSFPEFYVKREYDEIQKKNFGDSPLRLAEALHSQGKTRLDLKKDLRENIAVKAMYERNVLKPNTVSPLEIQNYYDIHCSELVQAKQLEIDQVIIAKEDENALVCVRECLARALPYEELYQQVSQVPDVSVYRMDRFSENDLLPIIAETVKTLSKDSFAPEPVEINGKLVFLGLRDVQEARGLSLTEARKQIEQILLAKKYQQLCNDWINGLKEKAYCVIQSL